MIWFNRFRWTSKRSERVVENSRHRKDAPSTAWPHEPPLEGRKKAGIHANIVGGMVGEAGFAQAHGTSVAEASKQGKEGNTRSG